MNRLVRLLCVFLFCIGSLAEAQNLGVGLYAFGSFDSRGFDTINIGNLNTHFEIPIFSKQGRGVPFSYTFAYDGLIWSPITVNGVTSWNPDSEWGFHGQLGGTGVVGYMTNTQRAGGECTSGGTHKQALGTLLQNFTYHEPFGKSHVFNYSVLICDSGDTVTGDGKTSDGSGYYFDGGVHTRFGALINAPNDPATTGISAGSITDSNGNTITNHGNGSFTDTLGVTALTIGGASTAASPLTFTYPVALQANGATSATATVFYRTYTVQTNFQCAVAEYGPNSVDLPDHVTLADGSTYSFTYEATPNVSGAVTGRLASINLPTEGTISYQYTGGCGAGINPDGTVGSLERTSSDGNRFYTRGTTSGGTNTNVQDEKGNGTLYQFVTTNGLIYETHRQVYQGPVVFQGTEGAAPNLYDQYTCYNGSPINCDGVALSLPITQTNVVSSYNNGSQLSVSNTYDASGMLTSSVDTSFQSGATLQKQTISYNNLEEPLSVSTYDGSSPTPVLIAQSTYSYDDNAATTTSGIPQHSVVSSNPGNQTSSHVMTAPGSTIDTTTAYFDTGVPVATTTLNGTTQFTYDPTQTFAMSTTLPTPSSGVQLSTSATYEQQSGVITSSTGMNGDQTQVTQYDPLLRPVVSSLPNGGQINYSYPVANIVQVTQPMGNGLNAETVTDLDRYGRTIRTAFFNGQSTNSWYIVDSCYDPTGLLSFQSFKYQGNAMTLPLLCSGGGTGYSYDALGRMISATTPDGTATWQYGGRAVLATNVNGVQRITQYDLLGRISGVCEISSTTLQSDSPGPCGMDIAGTGFLTTYSYNLATHTTTITQGAQTRIFTTDAAGRPTSVTEPERGVTTYSYAFSGTGGCTRIGLCVTRTRPKANQTNRTTLTTTVTQYDALGRVVTISYDDGVTPNKQYVYDSAIPVGWPNASSVNNAKGRLAVMGTSLSSNGSYWTGGEFSYDIMGNVSQMWQCTSNTCGNSGLIVSRPLSFSYDQAGNLISESDVVAGTISYSRSPAGEITSMTNQSYNLTGGSGPTNLATNVQNGPFGSSSYQLGNGLFQANFYDSLGRYNGAWVCYGAPAVACPSQAYGTAEIFKGTRVTAASDDVIGQGNSFGYDEFNRLTSTSLSNGAQTFSYTYDRYGNRLQQNLTGGSGSAYSPQLSVDVTTNHVTNSGFSYDAAGNLINDGTTSNSYIYDAEGNVLQVDGGAQQFVYDALNHRVRMQTSSYTNEYIYDYAGRRISTWNPSTNSGVEGRIYWDGKLIAFRASDNTTYFDHQDLLGTERTRTNYAGAVVSTYASLPWGDNFALGLPGNNGDQDQLHFAQLEHDTESNTEHAQFRQYSSIQGRWMSPDPYDGSYNLGDPQSLNRYSYVLNNPQTHVDPSGLCPPPPRVGPAPPCGGGAAFFGQGGGDFGLGNIDEFDLLQIPVSGYGFGYIPAQSWSGSVGGSQYTASIVNWGWGPVQIGTGLDLVGGVSSTSVSSNDGGGSSGPNNTPQNPRSTLCKVKVGGGIALDTAGTVAGLIPGASTAVVTTQVSLGLASSAYSAYNGSAGFTIANATGAQISAFAAGAEYVGWKTLAKNIPYVATAYNAFALGWDVYHAQSDYQTCLAGG